MPLHQWQSQANVLLISISVQNLTLFIMKQMNINWKGKQAKSPKRNFVDAPAAVQLQG